MDADGKFLACASHDRQHGRVSVDLRVGGADLSVRDAAGRPVQRRDLRRGEGGLHQHRARSTPIAAPAVRRRPSCSSAWWRRRRADEGIDPAELRRKNFIPAMRSRTRRRWRCSTTAATTSDARRRDEDRRLGGLRGAPRNPRRGQAARHRLPPTSRPAASRPRRWSAAGRAAPACGKVAEDPRQSDRQRHRDRHAQPRPGPRDHLRAAWSRTGSACRSSQVEIVHGDTERCRSAWAPMAALARGRRLGDHQGDGQDHRQGQEDRRASAGSRWSTTSSSRTASSRSPAPTSRRRCRGRARGLRAAQLPARGAGARPGRNRVLRSDQLHLPGRRHICEVEIDPDTGKSSQVVNFTAVDDFGRLVNPMIVEGQVHGGIAQGIGQALLEARRL
jgi:hypothetical protein